MDIASIALHFLCAAVAGFLIMSIFGVQALVALCSSISLARRRKHQVPAFDLALALRRIAWRTVIGFLGVAVISALMIWLTAAPGTFGYLSLRYDFVLPEEFESDDAQRPEESAPV